MTESSHDASGLESEMSRTESLLERCKEGDREALVELFREYAPYIHRVVRRHLPRNSLLRQVCDSVIVGEEVKEDLWAKFERGEVTAETEAAFKKLVVAVVENTLICKWRDNTCQRRDVRRTVRLEGATADTLSDPSAEPWQIASEKEETERLMLVLEDRELLLLYRSNVSLSSLVPRFGPNPHAVHSRCYRIEKRLRSEMRGGGRLASN